MGRASVFDMSDDGIHYENPFTTPPELRTPARRLRGRIAGGVTIWTSGAPDARAGLTVSSLLVVEGEPAEVIGALGDTSELWEAIHQTETFVVHVVDASKRIVADVFAGLRPSPGGAFAGLEVEDSEFGPVLPLFPARAYCRLVRAQPAGYQHLVHGAIAEVEAGPLDDPLLYFRGRYRRLQADPD